VTAPRVDRALHYQLDLAPTVVELLGEESPAGWDGHSFATSLRTGQEQGRDYLVVSQCAWSCQRSVRFGPWLLMRSYHDGLKDFPPVMLYNITEDPHETRDLASVYPQVADQGLALLEQWTAEMMASSPSDADPLWTVMREGGPLHTKGHLQAYAQRLRETGRAEQAERLLKRHPGEA
jgi:choline-sulfatase